MRFRQRVLLFSIFLLIYHTDGHPQSINGAPRLTSIKISDQGGDYTDTAIDTQQDTCGTAPDLTPEPFYDSLVKFAITNDSLTTIRITGYRYQIGSRRRSKKIGPVGSLEIASGEEGEISSIFTDASNSRKKVPGNSVISNLLGLRNVTFNVYGVNGTGKSFTLRGTVALVFRNVNRC